MSSLSIILLILLYLLYKVVDLWLTVRAAPLRTTAAYSLVSYHRLVTAIEIGVLAAAVPIVLLLLSSKWTIIRVFIAYNRTRVKHAERIRAAMNRCGFDAYLDGPGDIPEHDETIDRLLTRLDISDMVIALPGASTSFVDSEIFAASRSRLPMLLISCTDDDSLPNTMFSGYPTFEYDKLAACDFEPLGRFCRFAMNDWRFAFASLGETISVCLSVFRSPVGLGVSLIGTFLGYLTYTWAVGAGMLLAGAIYATFALICVFLICNGMLSARKASCIIRQKAITGATTSAAISKLAPSYIDSTIPCLKKAPLPFRHVSSASDGVDDDPAKARSAAGSEVSA